MGPGCRLLLRRATGARIGMGERSTRFEHQHRTNTVIGLLFEAVLFTQAMLRTDTRMHQLVMGHQ